MRKGVELGLERAEQEELALLRRGSAYVRARPGPPLRCRYLLTAFGAHQDEDLLLTSGVGRGNILLALSGSSAEQNEKKRSRPSCVSWGRMPSVGACSCIFLTSLISLESCIVTLLALQTAQSEAGTESAYSKLFLLSK